MATQPPESLLKELDQLEGIRDPSKQTLAQRQFQRFVVRADAELHPMNRSRLDATPMEVKLRDVGRGGVGFICSEPLAIDSPWRLALMNQGYKVGEQALIVRHCRKINNQLYLVGGQFVIETGMLVMLGVNPGALANQTDADRDDAATFLPPADVA